MHQDTGPRAACRSDGAHKKHLELFIRAYGTDSVKPKHHYALHLPSMLSRFGLLLGTLTHERKHRAVKRYGRGRTTHKSFEVGVLEDITAHNFWELGLDFFQAYKSSKPSRQQVWWLEDMFPENRGVDFTLHNDLTTNGGHCSAGDAVTFKADGTLSVGELLLTVGVPRASGKMLYSLLTKWSFDCGAKADASFARALVGKETIMVPTTALDTVLIYRMSSDRASALLYVPFECRD